MSEGSPQNTDVPEVVPKFQNLSIDQPPPGAPVQAPVQEQPPQPPADNNNTTITTTVTTTATTTDKVHIFYTLFLPHEAKI